MKNSNLRLMKKAPMQEKSCNAGVIRVSLLYMGMLLASGCAKGKVTLRNMINLPENSEHHGDAADRDIDAVEDNFAELRVWAADLFNTVNQCVNSTDVAYYELCCAFSFDHTRPHIDRAVNCVFLAAVDERCAVALIVDKLLAVNIELRAAAYNNLQMVAISMANFAELVATQWRVEE